MKYKKHENVYIHIKKRTLKRIVLAIPLIALWLYIISSSLFVKSLTKLPNWSDWGYLLAFIFVFFGGIVVIVELIDGVK